MEDLGGAQLGAAAKGGAVLATQQVAVPLAEGVVDLGDDRPQAPAAVMAEPEAHRLERVAQNPRKGVQPDLAVGNDAAFRQQAADPGKRSTARAVVALVEGQQRAPVQAEHQVAGGPAVEPMGR